jgi:hypothetical protein
MNASFAAAPTETPNVSDVATVREPLVARNVLPDPGLFTERLLNVANPPADVTWFNVPESVPPVLFVPNATVTLTPLADTALPEPSSNCTVTVPSELPAVVDVGCPTNASFVAAPTVMSNGSEVASVSDPLVACSRLPVPGLFTERLLNVASPPDVVVCVCVPDSVPPVLFVPKTTVTLTPLVATALPEASSNCTVTVPSELPAVVGEVG